VLGTRGTVSVGSVALRLAQEPSGGFSRGRRRAAERTKRGQTANGWRPATRDDGTQRARLKTRGATVGPRIVSPLERSVGMQHDGSGMTHGVGIGLGQHVDVVASAY